MFPKLWLPVLALLQELVQVLWLLNIMSIVGIHCQVEAKEECTPPV